MEIVLALLLNLTWDRRKIGVYDGDLVEERKYKMDI